MRHFTVLEFGKLEIGKDISSEEASAIQDVAGKVFTRYQSYLVAENYVGVIRSQHGLILEILPKIDLGLDFNQDDNSERTKQIFLRMLRCYRDLKRSLPQHDNNIRSLSKFPMLEIFIRLFLIDLQKLIHSGLAHRYVPIEENLPYLKGRLLFREQIRQNLVNASLLFVSHDTLSINRPANRLIRSTLNRLGRSIRGVENQLLHREMDLAFADVPESKNIRSDWKSHHIDRTMQLYHPIIKWVELFLFDQGLTAYSGKHRNISLLFPMERVFEDFVTHAFHRYQDQYRVKTQGPKKNS
ncbi:MAG: hypothetical protein OXE56_09270 [Gammaproteobacteria bacterium]|nr:hypothetical protein [Gammaproteobacteria bacterium]